MRERYPTCFLLGDGSKDFEELCRSLRFSTHCNYIILSSKPPFDTRSLLHMDWHGLDEISSLEFPDSEQCFSFALRGDALGVSRVFSRNSLKDFAEGLEIEKRRGSAPGREDEILGRGEHGQSESLMRGLRKHAEKMILAKAYAEVQLDFLLDYEGHLCFLGGIGVPEDGKGAVQLLDNIWHSDLSGLSLVEKFTKDKVFTLKLWRDQFVGDLRASIDVQKWGWHWSLYRAAGINIPLVLIQNLLNRKIKTQYFVDPDDIQFVGKSNLPLYRLEFEKVYFDLDETLVWGGGPLEEGINLLLKFHAEGIPLTLLTRHQLCIKNTLLQIGLHEGFFRQIIPVERGQKKSGFISGRALFIDNEFPERHDVRLNCNIPVLDLDQIDFLENK